jgi:hypothetical protein
MIKITWICLFMIVGIEICSAQPNWAFGVTNWGNPVHGVRFGLIMETKVIVPGSHMTFGAVFTNASTNDITLQEGDSRTDYAFTLTSTEGKVYHIPVPFAEGSSFPDVKLKPGTQFEEATDARLPADVESGDYTLTATRKARSKEGDFKLESNQLKLHVK